MLVQYYTCVVDGLLLSGYSGALLNMACKRDAELGQLQLYSVYDAAVHMAHVAAQSEGSMPSKTDRIIMGELFSGRLELTRGC